MSNDADINAELQNMHFSNVFVTEPLMPVVDNVQMVRLIDDAMHSMQQDLLKIVDAMSNLSALVQPDPKHVNHVKWAHMHNNVQDIQSDLSSKSSTPDIFSRFCNFTNDTAAHLLTVPVESSRVLPVSILKDEQSDADTVDEARDDEESPKLLESPAKQTRKAATRSRSKSPKDPVSPAKETSKAVGRSKSLKDPVSPAKETKKPVGRSKSPKDPVSPAARSRSKSPLADTPVEPRRSARLAKVSCEMPAELQGMHEMVLVLTENLDQLVHPTHEMLDTIMTNLPHIPLYTYPTDDDISDVCMRKAALIEVTMQMAAHVIELAEKRDVSPDVIYMEYSQGIHAIVHSQVVELGKMQDPTHSMLDSVVTCLPTLKAQKYPSRQMIPGEDDRQAELLRIAIGLYDHISAIAMQTGISADTLYADI